MGATKKISPAIEPIPVAIDDVDAIEICRNESCPIVEIHEAHVLPSGRGAPPKHCPVCVAVIPRGQGARCEACGWKRSGRPFARRKQGEKDDA